MTANTKKRTARARAAKKSGRARVTKKTGDVRSKPDQGRPAAADIAVTGRGIRHLRALGHHLDPVVQVGKEGVTDAVVAATREQLLAHELIKVRIGTEAPVDRKEAASDLAARTGATLAQVLGRTLLLYKRHPRKARIELPR
jgi:RNA-binding protein